MYINWRNIFGLLLFIFSIYLFFKMRPILDSILERQYEIRYYGHGPDMLLSVLKLAALCFTAIAIAKVLRR